MWATEQEALEEWRNRTLSAEDMEFYYQQRAEIEAENGYVRLMESGDHYMGEPEWAM
jgi:hypothetical protein